MSEDIKKLHTVILNTLKETLKIIERHDLKYYMLGGTMLGAIRHKGFIPWDDDIDIGMPRKDYELFLKKAPIELPSYYHLINFKTNKNYHYYITRIQNTKTKLIETRFRHENQYTHASIDIFPLDGSPNNKLLRKIFFCRILMHRAMMALHNRKGIDFSRKRGKFEQVLLNFLLNLPTEKLFDSYKHKCAIDRLLKKYEMSQSLYSGNIMGAYRTKEIVPTEYYGENSFYEFEGIKLRGLKEYDRYLIKLYGITYLELPRVEDRKTHFEIIDIG